MLSPNPAEDAAVGAVVVQGVVLGVRAVDLEAQEAAGVAVVPEVVEAAGVAAVLVDRAADLAAQEVDREVVEVDLIPPASFRDSIATATTNSIRTK